MPYSKRPARRNRPNSAQSAHDLLQLDNFQNGRMLAWFAIQQFDATGKFLSDILSDADRQHDLPSQERGLAVDLSSGVIRRRRTLDTLIESQITRPRTNVEPELWTLLQLGTYQLAFAKTPDHAAVDTIVELAKTVGQHRWCGFANGILRSISRLLTEDTVNQPAIDAIPVSEGIHRKLTATALPDPTTELVEYVGRAFSLPRAIARRWAGRMSQYDLMKACFHSNEVPVTVLRVNRLKATVGQVVSAFEEKDVEVTPGQNDWALRLQSGAKLTSLPGFHEGWWSVQDESAMRASELLAPKPGERILDLCAAPGGKSAHLAELSDDKATIIACDVAEGRLDRVTENADRLQLASIEPTLIERDSTNIPEGPYDAVLIDVPCSNTGVFARRPEARWRFKENDLEELVHLQTRLLLTAYDLIRPGGRIVYSTCSVEPEETTMLIESVTSEVQSLVCDSQSLQLPGSPTDGAFQALLTKNPWGRAIKKA